MAVRLNVIMIQTPPPDPAARRLGEAIVGELIGRPGLDLMLIDRLADVREGSTDRLTLESLNGDVAVLDWQTPQEIVDDLARLGFSGGRSPHADDPSAPASEPSVRRIYGFDLRQKREALEVVAALGELLAARRIKTFSLGPLTPRRPAGDESGKRSPTRDVGREPILPSSTGGVSEPPPRLRRQGIADLDLDALVDDLDAFDA